MSVSSGTIRLLRSNVLVYSCFYRQILATMSTRRIGQQLQEAVLTSLTALSRSAGSITQKNVDSAVDYVFEQASPK